MIETEFSPVGGQILEVSNTTWLIPGRGTKCYKKNAAANVLWDAAEEANCPKCRSIEEFLPKSSIKFVRVAGERMRK